ncbi:Hypothetical protein CINCED_3A001542 [Cinara cedri]|uniref:Uncharacterized protein n=1 Tax=Cinara cedri TaxID=506608 RepID=A0A5E4N4A1_9HEMI|nr:Hypothetical protein CINCED_3A001542 [Cinara cedri]
MRRSVFACCCCVIAAVLLSCLPPSIHSRTVSPITYVTATPASGGYSAARARYTGPGSSTYGEDATPYRYGHRSMPSAGELNRGRNERSHALYESPSTYEYMTNPEKSGRSRVPKTEKLPPGDDVELIDGGRLSGDRDAEDDRRAVHQDNKNKKKKKKKRKATSAASTTATATKRGHGKRDANRKGVVKRQKTEQHRVDEKGPQKNKKTTVKVATKSKAGKGNGSPPVAKHKILKKNEYSKKQQFFDEEHVVNHHGKKKPAGAVALHGASKRKNKDTTENSSGKKGNRHSNVKKEKKHADDNFYGYVSQQNRSPGYGQILAVR